MPAFILPTNDPGLVRLAKDINTQYGTLGESDPKPFGATFITDLVDKGDEFDDQRSATGAAKTAQKDVKELLDLLRIKTGTYIRQYFSNFRWLLKLGLALSADWTRFDLPASSTRMPPLQTDNQLRNRSQNVIDGENARRTVEGAVPITMPTLDEMVQTRADFVAQLDLYASKKLAYDQAQDALEALRKDMRLMLRAAYRTFVTYYRNQGMGMPDIRRMAREWGFTYRTLPGESPEEE